MTKILAGLLVATSLLVFTNTSAASAKGTHYDLKHSNGAVYPVYKESIEVIKEPLRVRSFVFSKDYTHTFIRGNQFEFKAGEKVILHENGEIAMTVIGRPMKGFVNWQMADGQQAQLVCGAIMPNAVVPTGRMRVLQFYPNGEYKRGCNLGNSLDVESETYSLTIRASTNIELLENGQLQYSNLASGEIEINGEISKLKDDTEIYFYPNGALNFYTMAEGQTLKGKTDLFGDVTVIQKEKAVSISFFEDGQLMEAFIAEDITNGDIAIPGGSRLIFRKPENKFGQPIESASPYLVMAHLSEPQQMNSSDGYSLKVKIVGFNTSNVISTVEVADAFSFTHPVKGETREFAPGSRVHFRDGIIVGIEEKLSQAELLEIQKKRLEAMMPGEKA